MDTHISSVTVFPDRARVVRVGRAVLQPGPQRVEVGDLPLALLPDSVRAAGRGAAQAKLVGVSTRREQFVESPAETARELEQKIETAQDAEADLAARSAILENEQKALAALAGESRPFARGLAKGSSTPQQQGDLFTFLRERQHNLQNELLQTARERRQLAKNLDHLRRELQMQESARPRQRYTALIELEVSAAGEFELELKYVVTGAAWQPLYDVRLTAAGLEVQYLAQVAQNTGEDWPAVALSLSTAQPALAMVVPELDPWYIQPLRPVPVARKGGITLAAGAPVPMPAAAFEPRMAAAALPVQAPLEELAAATAQVSESGAALNYQLAGRADIPGNNEPRKVTVGAFSLQPEFDYVTAPKLAAACFRRATVRNASPYTLLPGRVELFEGDEYLGAAQLEFVAPNQSFELVLGPDERLRVERELASREVDKTFIGDRRRIRFAYTIKIENLRDQAQLVYVRDQLPVARDEQIKVRLESADPRPAEQTELNLLEWKLTLERRAQQTIRFDFSVEHPRGMSVAGLP